MSGADTFTCPRCARRYAVVTSQKASTPPRCGCGAELTAAVLPSGVYELRRSRKATRRRPPRSSAARPAAPVPREPDQGYGESHGYGPAHGGPSGPGDAPADDAPAPPAAPPPDQMERDDESGPA